MVCNTQFPSKGEGWLHCCRRSDHDQNPAEQTCNPAVPCLASKTWNLPSSKGIGSPHCFKLAAFSTHGLSLGTAPQHVHRYPQQMSYLLAPPMSCCLHYSPGFTLTSSCRDCDHAAGLLDLSCFPCTLPIFHLSCLQIEFHVENSAKFCCQLGMEPVCSMSH